MYIDSKVNAEWKDSIHQVSPTFCLILQVQMKLYLELFIEHCILKESRQSQTFSKIVKN